MKFQIKILLISFLVQFVVTLIVIPIVRLFKAEQNERDDGPKSHLKKQGTPTMGGIGFMIAIAIVSVIVYYYYGKMKNEMEMAKKIFVLAIPTLCFGLIGLIDDFKKVILHNTKGLSPSKKMLGLLLVSVGFSIYLVKFLNLGTDIYIPFVKTSLNLNLYLYIPFVTLVMLATTNSINLTDGIDGLATSVCIILFTCLTVIGIMFNIKEIIVFGSIMIGLCISFLLFNLHPARIFMGDTGSLLLGGAVSIMAIYLKMPLLLIVIAIIPVLEAISDIIQVIHFKRTGNRVFKMAPLHHHFELSGWSENAIVSVFGIITLIASIVGLISI